MFEYHGAEDAERLIVIIGSGAETVLETLKALNDQGAKLGLLQVRLYRPFSAAHLLQVVPTSASAIAVLNRTKEPGAGGETLYQDLVTALVEGHAGGTLEQLPRVIGGRYGLSSKELTPAMVKAVYDELAKETPKNHFTIGIHDDVSHTSLEWDPGFDIEPQNVTRAKFYHQSLLDEAPEAFPSAQISAHGFPETRYSLQIYLEDCTGCGVCVESCPVHAGETGTTRAINLEPRRPQMRAGRENVRFFERLPINDRAEVDFASVRGARFLEPLFEFSLACSGCGETPYVKLLSQLYGPRLLVANATGCSSIYGGNLPTTPWTVNKDGRGPAWSNSLFEDNAEFGLGMRITADNHMALAKELVKSLEQQNLAVASGYWPLIRYNPALRSSGQKPFVLDSPRPRISLAEYAYNEARYKVLARSNPEEAEHLMDVAQELVNLRWETYEHMAQQGPAEFQPVA